MVRLQRERVGWEGPVLNAEEHTPDRRNSTAGTIQQEEEWDRERERKRKREREGWGHRGYVSRKKKKREVPHWILRRAAIPCFPEAWPCCTATDVDPLNGLLCDKRQWSRNRKQPLKHFITRKMCCFRFLHVWIRHWQILYKTVPDSK